MIAVAPQAGADLPTNLVPYAVQSATSADFERSQVLDATDYLNQRIVGVTVNSALGNPVQQNLQFRGFTATPLLGGSEGVSVFVDGVRVNELFGDTVNWDLIPEEAMSRMSLLSGANPIFGRNTLGGTILMQTKNGFSDPGTQAEAYAGSFGRSEATVESGGNQGTWGYYLLANHFEEDGWRDYSPSRASDFLGTLSWRSDRAEADLHFSHAETKLTGNGAQSLLLLERAPNSVFSAPDQTENFYSGITTQGRFKLDDQTSLDATVFVRQVNTRSYNGDATEFAPCADAADVLCDDNGTSVLDGSGHPISAEYDAIDNIGDRKQRSYGASLQAVFKQPLFGFTNQLVAGVDFDRGRVDYSSMLEAALFVADQRRPYSFITGADTGIFVPDDALRVHITEASEGIYLTDTLQLGDRAAVTLSGRYNTTHTVIADQTGDSPDLDGDHRFNRFNPSLGFTYRFRPALNFYASYSESTRAPTPVELTCASPDVPCKLPNDFVADPDLKQVVAQSFEGGLRGDLDGAFGKVHWQLGLFRTTNRNDLLFQSTGGAQSNEGFYANVGATRRQGIELAFSGRAFDERLQWYANYARLDATFRTSFEETSANSPAADSDGLIAVAKGDRIPGLPKNAIKIGADFDAGHGFSIGAGLVYNSPQYLRGDESNQVGTIGGFSVVNVRMRYRINEHFSVFARADNVFDRRYSNFGILANANGTYPDVTDARFVSPGSPRKTLPK
ncbi:MAG: TonB-dependent receptor, partial [Rudaea sp.]